MPVSLEIATEGTSGRGVKSIQLPLSERIVIQFSESVSSYIFKNKSEDVIPKALSSKDELICSFAAGESVPIPTLPPFLLI